MMISLSAPSYDLNGSVLLDPAGPDTDTYTMHRRVSRTATLDGGVVVTDYGFSHGDRILSVDLSTINEATRDKILAMLKSYQLITVSIPDGVFSASMESFGGSSQKLALWIVAKLS